LVLYNL